MTRDRTRENALRLCDAMNRHDLTATGDLLADDFFSHAIARQPGLEQGRQGGVAATRAFIAAFPDYHLEVLDLVVEGDRAVLRFRETGTHRGDDLGIPASGRRMDVEGVYIWRFDDEGMLAEAWAFQDNLAFLQQLGVIPEDMLER
jgi:steroid delta-isomerase-like uncharacterized protein